MKSMSIEGVVPGHSFATREISYENNLPRVKVVYVGLPRPRLVGASWICLILMKKVSIGLLDSS